MQFGQNFFNAIMNNFAYGDHFRSVGGGGGEWGGGTTYICPNLSSLPEKTNMFGQCIFVAHGGRGSFEVIGTGDHKGGRGGCGRGELPPTVGTF